MPNPTAGTEKFPRNWLALGLGIAALAALAAPGGVAPQVIAGVLFMASLGVALRASSGPAQTRPVAPHRAAAPSDPGGQWDVVRLLTAAVEARHGIPGLHLRRLEEYCRRLGQEMRLPQDEQEALTLAALVHDFGKLAVPDHILSKTSALTPDEFERVKVHPEVSASLIEAAGLKSPAAAIIRAHHERWNGTGYPGGLRGDGIPLAARILSAVEALDALLSDRPQRPRMALTDALTRLRAESGIRFDPSVVNVIEQVAPEVEAVIRGSQTSPALEASFAKILAARREAQLIQDMSYELARTLHLDHSLANLSAGLQRAVPFETMVVYVRKDGRMIPRYAAGETTSVFLTNEVPVGRGIVGRVAAGAKPLRNEPLSVEVGAPEKGSAMAIPLQGLESLAGVLLVANGSGRMSAAGQVFDSSHQSLLMAMGPRLGAALENAEAFRQATATASTDFLTGLPNPRAMQERLEEELSRAARTNGTLTLLVSDLDGFKDVNDRFGHGEGDAVLRAVARALREQCREYDYVARMGGDEFVFLLPGLDQRDLSKRLEQFNAAVEEASRKAVPGSHVGLSAGESVFPRDGKTSAELLSAADQRMYTRKQERKARKAQFSSRGYAFD